MATPNEHGVFPRRDCEEVVIYDDGWGCYLVILLAHGDDGGWHWGYDWRVGGLCVGGGGGGGFMCARRGPSVNRESYGTRADALRAAKEMLRKHLAVKSHHSGRVRSDRQRLLDTLVGPVHLTIFYVMEGRVCMGALSVSRWPRR